MPICANGYMRMECFFNDQETWGFAPGAPQWVSPTFLRFAFVQAG